MSLQDPPRASGPPIVGAAWPLWRDPLAYLRKAYAQHGDVFRVDAMHRRFVVLAGKEANRFLASKGRDKLGSYGFWGRFTEARGCPHMMLAIDGPDHRALRKVYRDDLSKRVVDERSNEIAALVSTAFDSAAGSDSKIPAVPLLRSLVSSQVFDLMSNGAPPIDDEDAEALRETFRWETNALLLGKWPKFALSMPSYRRFRARADAFIERVIADYEDAPPPGWFESTFRGRDELPHLFQAGDLRAAFLLPFVAGVDTVGATLGFLLWHLFRDAELRDRVRGAVDRVFDECGGVPPIDDLRSTFELAAAVRETMRLYPAAFAVYRDALETFEFAGRTVEEGTDVLVFTTAALTDADYFAEPERFDIDRFAAPRNEHKQGHCFAPYGGGPHVCLGAGMGEAQLLLTTAVLIREFEVEVISPTDRLRPHYDPSLTPPRDLVISVARRAHDPT